ncbi:hypothetical protein C7C46_23370 [Streptomyces tateyamensis]|uniref:SHOCT domain-containing protein n=2 Tax=Streptomyces tateyamensis TaxID=565073 RepID=A0A2V4MXP2_9ACTN|nr:hypothetical protein C7C46_23370 [Streptomyces tateyamensis]
MGVGGWGFGLLVTGVLILLVLLGLLLTTMRRGSAAHWTRPGPGPAAWGGSGGVSGDGNRSSGGVGDGAERILGERFARGEIDEEEYQRRLRVLRGGPAGAG